jgi:DNA polymerase-3 subunit gamma/tau
VAQALYRKWRPQSFDDVVGQEHVTTTLKNQIATGRIGHAYLFVGSRGCGKTTSARILAKEVNIAELDAKRAEQIGDAISEGRSLDVIEIDAASHTGVDAMRDILDKVNFQPNELRYKVYIVDEVHMLSTAAFNAMLKTLEEPPPHVIFILATTDPQKIPATVLSRCQRFTFKRVPVEKIVGRLRHLCDEEGIEADETALRLIARYATGSLRDAVSLLDQLASSNSMRITAGDVREALGATDAATVKALTEGIAARDVSAGFEAIQGAVDQGADARQIARQMVEYLRALMQVKVSTGQTSSGGDLSEAERIELAGHADKLSMAHLSRAVRAFSEAINEMRGTTDAQLPLEMAYLDCVVSADVMPAASASASAAEAKRSVPPAPTAKSAGFGTEPEKTSPIVSTAPKAGPAIVPATATTATLSTLTLPGDAGGGLTFEALNTQWQQFVREVNSVNKIVAALLRSCDLSAVTGNLVTLRAHHDIPYSRLQDPKNKATVISVLNRMFNGKYELRVYVNQADKDVDPDDDPVLKAAKKLGGTVRSQ